MNLQLTFITPLALALVLLSACETTTELSPTPASTSWTQAQAGNSWWLNVWASAADDRWVVGGTNSKGAILHYDGNAWSPIEPGIDIPLLNWTHGFAKNNLVMVGNGGTILTYDGNTFTKEQSPTQENLWGVWGATEDRVYAVGGSGRPESKATLLLRDNGVWTELEPEFTRENVFAFFKVWGSADDDVYVVGQKGIVMHWNGNNWQELDVFGEGQTARDLISVWGSSSEKVAIVGGRNNGVLILKDGPDVQNDWRTIDLAANAYAGLNGVWMRGSKVHASGNFGQVLRFDYDTGAIEQDILLRTELDLHAIHGSPDGVLTTVSFNPIAPSETDAEGEIFTRLTNISD
jgi:hypothetical protein